MVTLCLLLVVKERENEEFDQYRVYNSLVDFRSSVKDMFDGYNQYYYPCTAGFSSRPTIEN